MLFKFKIVFKSKMLFYIALKFLKIEKIEKQLIMLAYNTLLAIMFLGIDISQNYAFNYVVTCMDQFCIYMYISAM